MRDLLAALGGLTTRGRCFLAAGVACALSAFVLGERDLLRVGVLLLALPVVAAVVVARTRYRLACSRRLEPARVPAGRTAKAFLRLDNVSRLPTSVLLMEDAVPYVLGGRPRFVLDRVEPGGTRDVEYTVRGELRGRYHFGPLSVWLTDPFGFCELTRSFSARDELVVTPVVDPLPPVRLGGDWTGGGDTRARSIATSGEDDVATRTYRQGDDLRRVHWRSTARAGELMVRREEHPWQSRATLLLDTRATAHVGEGPRSSFEWAVSAIASVAVHLGRVGYALRLVLDGGEETATATPASASTTLLDGLATVERSAGVSLRPAASRLSSVGRAGLLVAVLGALDPDEAAVLARTRAGAGLAVAILLDTASWGAYRPGHDARAALEASAELLRAAGWRVLVAGYGGRLPELWSEVAPDGARAGRAPTRAAGGGP
ncbi:MAG TPA: DUF58 domain-containing protein [Frankiaceae bacterium]|nr:DUF58 domain-containing protein [Frankiaceae bacterium]